MGFGLMLRSLIHFELNFENGVKTSSLPRVLTVFPASLVGETVPSSPHGIGSLPEVI